MSTWKVCLFVHTHAYSIPNIWVHCKSRSQTRSLCSLAVNLGVYSNKLLLFFLLSTPFLFTLKQVNPYLQECQLFLLHWGWDLVPNPLLLTTHQATPFLPLQPGMPTAQLLVLDQWSEAVWRSWRRTHLQAYVRARLRKLSF